MRAETDIATFMWLTLPELSIDQQISEINRRWPTASQEELEAAARAVICRLRTETAALQAETALLKAPTLGTA